MERDSNLLLCIGLFGLTLVTMFVTQLGGRPFTDPVAVWEAVSYTGALSAILVAHEAAHYLVAKRHGFALSLPFFVPFPFGFGTLGAIISLRSVPRNRTALLEMGAAGPVAGALVSFAMLAVGLPLSSGDAIPEVGMVVPVFNDPPALRILGWLFLGAPPSLFAMLHPIALAGWIGCLLTAINLLPFGQTDGGHIVAALAPRLASRITGLTFGVLLAAGTFSPVWLVWAGLLLAMGAWKSIAVPESPGLTRRARLLVGACLLIFGLTFIPRPAECVALDADGNVWSLPCGGGGGCDPAEPEGEPDAAP